MLLLGCDFSSTPTRRKPIVIAIGSAEGGRVQLARIETLETLSAFGDWLRRPQSWIGGFDFPVGLPRELVEHLGWPTSWREWGMVAASALLHGGYYVFLLRGDRKADLTVV